MRRRLSWGAVAALALGGLAFAGRGLGRPASAASSLPFYDSADFTPRWSPVAHTVGPFQLQTQTGAPVRETDLENRIHVASFIFTRCPNLCPTLVERLGRVERAARAWPDVVLVSYSVIPALDTPEVLAGFGRAHKIDPEHWWLVTGAASQIERLARESYFASDPRPAETKDTDTLLHTETVVLVDQRRHLRGVYNGTQPFEIERLLEDIRTLRKEGQS